jgi:hypothetical protein
MFVLSAWDFPKRKAVCKLLCRSELSFLILIHVFFKLVHMGQCFYNRDPRGETSACVVLVLALVAVFVENPVYVEKCSLRVKLPGETIELESYVIETGDSKEEELVCPILKRASDAYGEYRVGPTQA